MQLHRRVLSSYRDPPGSATVSLGLDDSTQLTIADQFGRIFQQWAGSCERFSGDVPFVRSRNELRDGSEWESP